MRRMGASIAESGPWTVSRLLAWTREYLQRQRVESPRLCAELLLAHAMGCPRIRLYTQYEAVPGPEELAKFRAAVRAAASGTPIAYLTGTKEFFALEFEVTPAVLIPRPETEVLVERTIDLVRHSQGLRKLLDLGTGSGCIAIALGRNLPDLELYASDNSEPALEVAHRNAARHSLAERIEFRHGDLFAPWSTPATGAAAGVPPFDVIVSNPPYVATAPGTPVEENVRRYEPPDALFAGPEGLDVIRRIVAEAPPLLAPGGHLLLEMGFDQARKVRDLLSSPDWHEVTTYRDAAGHERAVHARRRTG